MVAIRLMFYVPLMYVNNKKTGHVEHWVIA